MPISCGLEYSSLVLRSDIWGVMYFLYMLFLVILELIVFYLFCFYIHLYWGIIYIPYNSPSSGGWIEENSLLLCAFSRNVALAAGSWTKDAKCWQPAPLGKMSPCLGAQGEGSPVSLAAPVYLAELWGPRESAILVQVPQTFSKFLPNFSRFSWVDVSLFAICL